MKHLDEMYPWELEEHLDIQGTRSESEIETYCKDCICTEECTQTECIKIGGIRCSKKQSNQYA